MENKKFIERFSFNQESVIAFSEVSRDTNPIHLDKDFASKTIFKKPIIHGFLGGSIFSKIIGNDFPGEGSIYLKQEMKFMAPMFVNTEYEAIVEIDTIDSERGRAVLKTRVYDTAGKVIIDGEALVKNSIFNL